MTDEYKTVVFRSNIEIKGQNLPTIIITDETIWTLIRIQIVAGAAQGDKKASVQDYLNGLNQKYKAFKFYVADNGDVIMDISVPTIADHFDAEMLRSLLQITVEQLTDIYPQIMEVVWAK